MTKSAQFQSHKLSLAYQLHATLLNSIGALVVQSQICERAMATGASQSLDELARLRTMIKDLEASTREIIDGTFERGSPTFTDALLDEIVAFERRHPGIEVDASVEVEPGLKTRWVTQLIVDTVHEALANAARHGRPSRIEVRASATQDGVLLRIRDNGQGFDARRLDDRRLSSLPGRYGIRIMQESAKSMQGRLEISSAPGRGTQVTLFIPTK